MASIRMCTINTLRNIFTSAPIYLPLPVLRYIYHFSPIPSLLEGSALPLNYLVEIFCKTDKKNQYRRG